MLEAIRKLNIEDKVYYVAKDVAVLFGCKLASNLTRGLSDAEKFKIKYNTNGGEQSILVINEIGLKKAIIKSRKPIAIDLAKELEIDINNEIITCKEQETIHIIKKSFKNYSSIEQFKIKEYRIDLYFPKLKLAIECDEFGHINRDKYYEKDREKNIKDSLNCSFIRYNPDDKDFNIGDIINKIVIHIQQQNKLNMN